LYKNIAFKVFYAPLNDGKRTCFTKTVLEEERNAYIVHRISGDTDPEGKVFPSSGLAV
jgi:hypothetical protein